MICNLKHYQNPQHSETLSVVEFLGFELIQTSSKSNVKVSSGVFVGLLWLVTGFYDSIISQAQLHKQSAATKRWLSNSQSYIVQTNSALFLQKKNV